MTWAALIDDEVRVRNATSADGRGWDSIRGGWASKGPALTSPTGQVPGLATPGLTTPAAGAVDPALASPISNAGALPFR